MRKSFLAAALFAALPLVATAMPHEHHKPRMHAERPMAGIELTREQRQQFAEVKRETLKARQQIKQRYLDKLPEADKRAMHNDLNALKDNERRALNKILTKEQQKAFAERETRRQAHASDWAEFKKWQAEHKKP